jgi:hypothetical protein
MLEVTIATIWLLSIPQFSVEGSVVIARIRVPPFLGLP